MNRRSDIVKFFSVSVRFLALNSLIGAVFLYTLSFRSELGSYPRDRSESSLAVTGSHSQFDFIVLGASRARQFTRYDNQRRVEEILGKTFLNLAKAAGGGVVPALLSLKNFYRRANRTPVIIYFLDPFALCTRWSNELSPSIIDEPFDWWYLVQLFNEGLAFERIRDYVRGNIVSRRGLPDVYDLPSSDTALAAQDPSAISNRLAMLYPNGCNQDELEKGVAKLNELHDLALGNGARLVIIRLPTLLGPEPGSSSFETIEKIGMVGSRPTVVDLSSAINDPRCFEDHDHLNTAGIELVTRYFLEPLLENLPKWTGSFHERRLLNCGEVSPNIRNTIDRAALEAGTI